MLRKVLPGLLAGIVLAAAGRAETVDEVIARSFEARGGLERLRAVKTLRVTGRMSMGQEQASMVVERKRPGSLRAEITVRGTRSVQAWDGVTAWGIAPMGSGQPELLPKEAATAMAADADVDGPLVDYQAKGHQVTLLGRVTLDSGDAWKLEIRKKDGGVEVHYLDARSWLTVRIDGRRRAPGGTIVEGESILSDYREAGGILWPCSIRSGARGNPEKQTLTIEKIEVDPPLDDARFRMPSTAPGRAPRD
jgi:hypothetical protein